MARHELVHPLVCPIDPESDLGLDAEGGTFLRDQLEEFGIKSAVVMEAREHQWQTYYAVG